VSQIRPPYAEAAQEFVVGNITLPPGGPFDDVGVYILKRRMEKAYELLLAAMDLPPGRDGKWNKGWKRVVELAIREMLGFPSWTDDDAV